MGMSLELLAVGPFRKSPSRNYSYSSEHYEGIEEEEAKIITTVLSCETSSSSQEVLGLFGIGASDFSHHVDLELTEDMIEGPR